MFSRSDDMENTGGMHTGSDRGFTLVELLIVIVILGILATVTVFAVRGITQQGQENACSADLKNLATAEDAHWALNGSYADEATLVANGSITKASANFDVTSPAPGDTYAIDPVAGSQCTVSTTGGSAAAAPPPPATLSGSPTNFHRHAAVQIGDLADAEDVVIVGGASAQADWEKTITDGVATGRRVTFIKISDVTSQGDLDFMIDRAKSTGQTVFLSYSSDSAATVPGTATTFAAYLGASIDPAPPDHAPDEYHTLTWGGFDLSAMLAALG